MSQAVDLAGTEHTLPTSNDVDYGSALAAFLAALPTKLGPAIIQLGAELVPDAAGNQYLRPGNGAAADTTEQFVRVPSVGKVWKLYVQSVTAPVGTDHTITVRKNGVATTLTASLLAAATQASDVIHSFTVAAGDRISVSCARTGGSSTPATGLVVTMLFSADA